MSFWVTYLLCYLPWVPSACARDSWNLQAVLHSVIQTETTLIVADAAEDGRWPRVLFDLLAATGYTGALKTWQLGAWSTVRWCVDAAMLRKGAAEPPVAAAGLQGTRIEFCHGYRSVISDCTWNLRAALYSLLWRRQRRISSAEAHVIRSHHTLTTSPSPSLTLVKGLDLSLSETKLLSQ